MFKILKYSEGNYFAVKAILYIIICAFIIILLFCITAFVLLKTDYSNNIIDIIITAILAISCALSSFVITALNKEKGLIWGIFCAITISLLIIILSVINHSFSFSNKFFTQTAIILLSGIISGIVSVNVT